MCTIANSCHYRMLSRSTTNSIVHDSAKRLAGKCPVSGRSSNWHRCRWHRPHSQTQGRRAAHTPNQTMRHGRPAQNNIKRETVRTWNRKIFNIGDVPRGNGIFSTLIQSHIESCSFLAMYRCRMRSLAMSRCQSIVWKSSYWPMPGMSSPASVSGWKNSSLD